MSLTTENEGGTDMVMPVQPMNGYGYGGYGTPIVANYGGGEFGGGLGYGGDATWLIILFLFAAMGGWDNGFGGGFGEGSQFPWMLSNNTDNLVTTGFANANTTSLLLLRRNMKIDEINTMIEDLQTQDLTYTNCRNLAALYTLRNYLSNSEVEKEYNDILPEYRKYCEYKRKYQIGELSEDIVIQSLKLVCREIFEFCTTLYNNTDMYKERREINQLIDKLKIALK